MTSDMERGRSRAVRSLNGVVSGSVIGWQIRNLVPLTRPGTKHAKLCITPAVGWPPLVLNKLDRDGRALGVRHSIQPRSNAPPAQILASAKRKRRTEPELCMMGRTQFQPLINRSF